MKTRPEVLDTVRNSNDVNKKKINKVVTKSVRSKMKIAIARKMSLKFFYITFH